MVYKPANVPTTPGEKPDSLVEQVLVQFPELSQVNGFKVGEGGLLYRLDTITSGLVLFACNDQAFKSFIKAADEGKIKKKYLAKVLGHMERAAGYIDWPIAHHPTKKSRMIVYKDAGQKKRGQWRDSITDYRVVKLIGGNTLLEIAITQGARHQIRVHLAAIGNPLCGDPLYNPGSAGEEFLLECISVEWVGKDIFSLQEILGDKKDAL
ncbi:MAG: RNA pseudouridine synthase [Candidatus Abawacabacteria bacterium]|nr:RNA pseudouridine synthase [Candidatus Abawacabacteria bacterium]